MNSSIVLIIVAFLIAAAAIYALYSIILFQGVSSKGEDLQLTTKKVLEQVEVLYEKGEYAILELLATKYLDRVPSRIEVRIYLAKAYYESKKYSQAIKQCNIILKKRPYDVDTREVLGKCYVKKHSYIKAIREFNFVYDRNKKNKEALLTLAELYVETDQLVMAIQSYGELVQLLTSPTEQADIQAIIADLNEQIYDYAAAFEAYKARLAVYPKDVDTNKKLVELYVRINNYNMAIETLLLMLSFVTESKMLLWIYDMLVDLYETMGEYDKAIAYAEKMLDVQGSDKFKLREKIAQFNLKLGNVDDGILILEDLTMLSQNAFDITTELAAAYIARGDYQNALDRYMVLLDKAGQKEAKQVNMLICDLYVKWATVATNNGDLERSMELLESAERYNTINPEVYYSKANNKFLQKNYNGTVESVSKALEYDKEAQNSPKYLLLLAQAQHELGNFFEEKKALTDLLNVEPDNAEGLYRVGMMYASQRNVKNAEEAFKKAIASNPEMIQAKYNLAILYENSNKDKAKELYLEVLEQDPTFVEAKNALADISTPGSL